MPLDGHPVGILLKLQDGQKQRLFGFGQFLHFLSIQTNISFL
jgi:hypothetical protein